MPIPIPAWLHHKLQIAGASLFDPKNPWLDIRKHLPTARGQPTTSANHGDVWFAVPKGTVVHVHYRGYDPYPGYVVDGKWFPESEGTQAAGPQALKLFMDDGSPPKPRPRQGFRPGATLNRSSCAMKPNLEDYRRATWVPSYSEPSNRYGELAIEWPAALDFEEPSYLKPWQCWGMETTTKGGLLKRLTALSDCHVVGSDEKPLQAAAERLAILVGLGEPKRPWQRDPSIDNPPERGEILRIKYDPQRDPVYSLVVSPSAFNAALDAIVVLRCVSYESVKDESHPLRLPLGPQGRLDGINFDGALSIAIEHLRGIAYASKFYDPEFRGIRFDQRDSASFERLVKRLRFYYA